MDYVKMFNGIHPGFFDDPGTKGMPKNWVFSELIVSFSLFASFSSLLSIVLFRFKELYRNIRQLLRPNPAGRNNICPRAQNFIVMIQYNCVRRTATIIDIHIEVPSFVNQVV